MNSADVSAVPKVIHVHVGNSEVCSAKRTSVDAQAFGIDLVVDVNELRKARVTKAAFQDFVVADIPSPARASHLRT